MESEVLSFIFKGAGPSNHRQICYLYNLCCCPHVPIVLCTDFGVWGQFTIKLLLKIHQYLCNQHNIWMFDSLQNSRVHLKINLTLRKVAENICDLIYRNIKPLFRNPSLKSQKQVLSSIKWEYCSVSNYNGIHKLAHYCENNMGLICIGENSQHSWYQLSNTHMLL